MFPVAQEGFAFRIILQHYLFVVLVFSFGIFEWPVRTGRLRSARSALVLPLLAAVGAGLLLAHTRTVSKTSRRCTSWRLPTYRWRPRMLHGMGAMARAAAAVAGQSRVGLGLVAGAGSDRRAAPALPGELTGSRNSLRIAR